jgi:hypothetical protein
MTIITYDQKLLWKNWCTFFAIITNLSNLTQRRLSIDELKEWYASVWLSWNWSLANIMVDKVLLRWNNKFKSKITKQILTISNWLKELKKWKMLYIWFRRDIDMYVDTQDNWRVDRIPPIWPKEWWHSSNMIWDWNDYIIIDNYEDRKYKYYKVSESIMEWLIKNRIIRATSYIFNKS